MQDGARRGRQSNPSSSSYQKIERRAPQWRCSLRAAVTAVRTLRLDPLGALHQIDASVALPCARLKHIVSVERIAGHTRLAPRCVFEDNLSVLGRDDAASQSWYDSQDPCIGFESGAVRSCHVRNVVKKALQALDAPGTAEVTVVTRDASTLPCLCLHSKREGRRQHSSRQEAVQGGCCKRGKMVREFRMSCPDLRLVRKSRPRRVPCLARVDWLKRLAAGFRTIGPMKGGYLVFLSNEAP